MILTSPSSATGRLAFVQALAPAESEELHAVLVVADEQAGGSVGVRKAFGRYAQTPPRKMPHHAEECRNHGHPFSQPMAGSAVLAVDHHVGIDADRGIVDEDLAVDLAEIGNPHIAFGDHCGGLADLQGNAEIFGEMVERAEGDYPERHGSTGKHAGRRPDAAIAAADHDGVDLAAPGLCQGPCRSLAQPAAFDELDFRRNAVLRQARGKCRAHIGGEGLAEGPGAAR